MTNLDEVLSELADHISRIEDPDEFLNAILTVVEAFADTEPDTDPPAENSSLTAGIEHDILESLPPNPRGIERHGKVLP